MCSAATEGDVRQLKILIRCGVHPDSGDYDNRQGNGRGRAGERGEGEGAVCRVRVVWVV